MSNKASRDVLDWFRQFAVAKLNSVGATVDASNMNVPFNNDVRVQAALDYLLAREAQILLGWTAAMDAAWDAVDDEIWPEIEAQMPQAVRNDWNLLWTDPDPNVIRLLKTMARVLCELVVYVRNGGV